MFLRSVIIFYLCVRLCKAELYSRYTSVALTEEELAEYKENNAIARCTIDIKPCNESERRRVDGSCNNLKYPAAGTHFQPMYRMESAHFSDGSQSRKAQSGKNLTLPRVVRTRVLEQGKSYHPELTQLVPGFGIFAFMDFGSVHDIDKFIFTKTDCCEPEHMNDRECSPNIVPWDDPVLRFTNIRCMNLTTPLTYQDYKCTKDPIPSPIANATAVFDLSQIYNYKDEGASVIRSFISGQLAVEEESGKMWPLSNENMTACPLNVNSETRCYKHFINGLLSNNMHVVWFVRNHNYLAETLSAINPCWDDERLFQEAREINIAMAMQIYFYEWMPTVIDYKTLVKYGVISDNPGFRDIYNENVTTAIPVEYVIGLRWFHLIQDATAKMYSSNFTLLGETSIVEFTFRTGWLCQGDRMEQMTKAYYTQPCRDTSHSIDHDMAERGLTGVQSNVDLAASDLHKSRLMGMAPYIQYVYSCHGINITCFDDLRVLMSEDMIRRLKDVYADIKDLDFLAGMWGEEVREGDKIPPTLVCVLLETFHRLVVGDRHFYERKDRPYAFTTDQLAEIRKVSLSSVLCTVGDDVTKIQRKSLLNISPENPLVSCNDITKINLNAWADPSCNSCSEK